MKTKLIKTKEYLLLIDEEGEIKKDTYYVTKFGNIYKETERLFEEDEKIERFTNRDFYKPILAYFPLKIWSKKLDLPLLPSPFNIDDINIEEIYPHKESFNISETILNEGKKISFIKGYLAAQKIPKQFNPEKKSIEDIEKELNVYGHDEGLSEIEYKEYIKTNSVYKTKINSEGKEVLLGTYAD